ncbi:MAG: hypothetical protein NUV57_04725 [archaeon]|nr:hypothetical protein [archaeon]
MLIETISHLLGLDFGWFIKLATVNPIMTFMLIAVFFIFLEGQNLIKGGLIILVAIFASLDFGSILGVAILTGSFMAIYYMSKISVLLLAEGSDKLKKYMMFINELQFFGVLIIVLLFFP